MANMHKQTIQVILAAVLLVAAVGSIVWQLRGTSEPDPYNVQGPIVFSDNARTNATASAEQLDLRFVDGRGREVKVADLQGKKNVVLVMTRGYYQARCPYCTAQTSRLISNYAKFVERDAEVLVVYPGPQDHLQDFLDAVQADADVAQFPFAMLFDKDMRAVDQLGIRWQLARPSTYILDKQGNLAFAYVGKDIADRPSIQAMLDQLDKLSQAAPP